jgi:ATP-dependent DNA helicase DinG
VEGRSSKEGPVTSLHMAPLDVSAALKKGLFEAHRAVILTSATLAADGSFRLLKSRLGVEASLEVLLDSPFRYAEQAAVYTDLSVPDPGRQPQRYEEAVARRCLEILQGVPGGTFILFTSWKLLDRTYRFLEKAGVERPLFRQGDRPPGALLEAFRRAGNGVLLGTETFWQGVDVPGPALSCVVITRLPFLVPGSPLEEARQERIAALGQDPFREDALPRAVIKFRQGFGRLIRSGRDTGAVAILDPRIRTKPYGAVFLRSIPVCRRLRTLDDLRAFLQRCQVVPTPSPSGGR